MVVTTKRILFICLEGSGCNKIRKQSCGYIVDSTFKHARAYFPIDLADVCGIRFHTKDGQTNESVSLDSDASESDGKPLIMTLTLKLPPWGVPCEMEIKICENVSFDTLKRAISAIEENSVGSDNAGAKAVAGAKTLDLMQVSKNADSEPDDCPDDFMAAAAAVRETNA